MTESLSALCGSIVTLCLTRLCIDMKTPECFLCKNFKRFTRNRLAGERADSGFSKHSVPETNETPLFDKITEDPADLALAPHLLKIRA